MKRFLLKLVSLALMVLVASCAVVTSGVPNVLFQIDDISTGAMQTQPSVVEINGQPAVLYATKEGRVVFQHGKQRLLLDETAPVKGGNRFQLAVQDQNLHAHWWSHQDAKNLYFSTSSDSGSSFAPVNIVNDNHGVLAPFSILRGPQGVVGMTYLDERAPRFQAYFNRSTDYGRSWARPDQRLDTPPVDGQASFVLDFQSVESGSVWVSAWLDVNRTASSPNYKILSSRSQDSGLHWSEPEVLFSSDKFIASLAIQAQGQNVVVAADENERGIITLVSNDNGNKWQALGALAGSGMPAGTEGFSNSGIRMTLAGDKAHVVWMEDSKGVKTVIKHGRLNLLQARWMGDAARLDIKTVDNTRSILPTIVAPAKGPLAVAWLDYRDIRPNVYYSTSSDQGKTWSPPRALLKPGEVSAGLPRLLPWGDQAAVAYEIYPKDLIVSEGSFVLRLLPLELTADASFYPTEGKIANEAERKNRLKQRIKTMWDHRIAGNYRAGYEFFDFAFKAANPEQVYVNSVGLLTYIKYSQGDISIAGNEATVKMKLHYKVDKFTMPTGKEIKAMPPTESDAEHTWVWVNDDWYFVYKPVSGESTLRY
jgi:hypothetical protein